MHNVHATLSHDKPKRQPDLTCAPIVCVRGQDEATAAKVAVAESQAELGSLTKQLMQAQANVKKASVAVLNARQQGKQAKKKAKKKSAPRGDTEAAKRLARAKREEARIIAQCAHATTRADAVRVLEHTLRMPCVHVCVFSCVHGSAVSSTCVVACGGWHAWVDHARPSCYRLSTQAATQLEEAQSAVDTARAWQRDLKERGHVAQEHKDQAVVRRQRWSVVVLCRYCYSGGRKANRRMPYCVACCCIGPGTWCCAVQQSSSCLFVALEETTSRVQASRRESDAMERIAFQVQWQHTWWGRVGRVD